MVDVPPEAILFHKPVIRGTEAAARFAPRKDVAPV